MSRLRWEGVTLLPVSESGLCDKWQRQFFFWSHSDSIQVFTTKLVLSPQVREILYSSESFIAWMTDVGCVWEILMNLKLCQVTCNNLKKEGLPLAQSGSDLFLVIKVQWRSSHTSRFEYCTWLREYLHYLFYRFFRIPVGQSRQIYAQIWQL